MYTPTQLVTALSLYLSSLLLICLPASAQTKPVVLTLNFQQRERGFNQAEIDKLNKLKRGQYFVVQVCNINTLNYRVIISSKDTAKSTGLTVPTYAGLGIADLTSLANLLPGFGINAAPSMKSIDLQLGEIDELLRLHFKAPVNKPQNADGIISNYVGKLGQRASRLISLNDSISQELMICNGILWNAKLDEPPATPLDKSYLRAFWTNAINLQNQLVKLSNAAANENAAYLRSIKSYPLTTPSLKARDEEVKAVYKELTDGLAKVKDLIAVNTIRPLADGLVAAINNSSYTYTSLPFLFSKDQTTIRLAIIPQSGITNAQSYSTALFFPLASKSFWGVSSGFYVSGLYNDAYSTQAIQTTAGADATYAIKQEVPGNYEFGVSAMVRYGYNPFKNVPVGLQIGFGPALAITNKVRPRLLLGGGLAIGNNEKLLLDFGANLGYVDRLSSTYEYTTQLAPTYYTQPTNLTVSTFKCSWFAGIHYLFLKH